MVSWDYTVVFYRLKNVQAVDTHTHAHTHTHTQTHTHTHTHLLSRLSFWVAVTGWKDEYFSVTVTE